MPANRVKGEMLRTVDGRGINDSDTMAVNKYFGAGLTGFGLVPGRPKDSMGAGVAVSWLNENLGFRSTEVMLAAYYQAHVWGDIYVQPTLTHVPNPTPPPRAATLPDQRASSTYNPDLAAASVANRWRRYGSRPPPRNFPGLSISSRSARLTSEGATSARRLCAVA